MITIHGRCGAAEALLLQGGCTPFRALLALTVERAHPHEPIHIEL